MSPTAIADTRNDPPFVGEYSEAALGKNASNSEGQVEFSEHVQPVLNTSEEQSEELINNLGEKFSKEVAQIWSEIGDIKSSLTNRDGLWPLQQELDELRLKCTTYESTIDHLEKEKASLPEVIKILSSDDNNRSTYISDGNEPSDCTTRENEWTEVSNSKKKKKKPKASNTNTCQQHISITSEQEPQHNTSNTSHTDANSDSTMRQKPSVIIAGDSMLKFVSGRKQLNLLSNQSSILSRLSRVRQ